MTANAFFLQVFNGAFILACLISGFFVLITLLNLLVERRSAYKPSPCQDYPFITVQVPSFNDPVAARCIEACLRFSYPQDRYDIMILDDSTDRGTANLLAAFAHRYPERVGYFFRDNRAGYKPGALKTWMPKARGDLIVIFDADFVPPVDFLECVAQPFEDPQVAIVQARQSTFLNSKANLVARFASYLLRIYNYMLLPITHHYNAVFFCGTAGALRKRAVEEVGGWNTNSITEDSDLSVRLLARGYRSIYLPMDALSEVPVTVKAFLKQQMRWTFGNVRVFFDNFRTILRGGHLSLQQRLLISFMTLGSAFSPVILVMTVSGLLASVTGLPQPFSLANLLELLTRAVLTSGFLLLGIVGLHKQKNYADYPYFLFTSLTLGLLLTGALTLALYRAVFHKNKPLYWKNTSWICTPKHGNEHFQNSNQLLTEFDDRLRETNAQ